jgi:hypothetical protein
MHGRENLRKERKTTERFIKYAQSQEMQQNTLHSAVYKGSVRLL